MHFSNFLSVATFILRYISFSKTYHQSLGFVYGARVRNGDAVQKSLGGNSAFQDVFLTAPTPAPAPAPAPHFNNRRLQRSKITSKSFAHREDKYPGFDYSSLLKDKNQRPLEELLNQDQINCISSLVENRSNARSIGDYKSADSIRDQIATIPSTETKSSHSFDESISLPIGYKIEIKDIPRNEGGGSSWSLQPTMRGDSVHFDAISSSSDNEIISNGGDSNPSSVLALAHAALDLASSSSEQGIPIDHEQINAIVLKAKKRLMMTGDQELRGRKAADAVFWFALAGVRDNGEKDEDSDEKELDFSLFEALTHICLEELTRFGKRSSCRAMDIMHIIERVAAAGITTETFQKLQKEAAVCLESKNKHDIAELDRRGVLKCLRRGEFELHSERSLLWIWRFSAKQRKQKQILTTLEKPLETIDDCKDDDENEEEVNETNGGTNNPTLHRVEIDWNDMFEDPSLPLVIDIGCGMGVSILGLSTLKDRSENDTSNNSPMLNSIDWSGCNYLGADLSRLAINFATRISQRWQINGRTQFIVRSGEETLEEIINTYPGKVQLCMIQFPTPFRFVSDDERSDSEDLFGDETLGNQQLPNNAFNGFMVSRNLLNLALSTLDSDSGRLLLQSNVEDVAVFMKNTACDIGFEPIKCLPSELDNTVHRQNLDLPKRMEKWMSIGGERAQGDIWNTVSVIPPRGKTETEAACLVNGTPIHRCLLKVNRINHRQFK